MENKEMKKYYEDSIAESKLRQGLIRTGIKVLITERPDDLDHIQTCFDILKKEHSQQVFCEQQLAELLEKDKQLANEISREKAKEILGLKRDGE